MLGNCQAQRRGTVTGRYPKRIEKLPQQARWPERSNRSPATDCNFGKLDLEKDTIPKAFGLDLFGVCSAFVRESCPLADTERRHGCNDVRARNNGTEELL
jgi:hypothetical protein